MIVSKRVHFNKHLVAALLTSDSSTSLESSERVVLANSVHFSIGDRSPLSAHGVNHGLLLTFGLFNLVTGYDGGALHLST